MTYFSKRLLFTALAAASLPFAAITVQAAPQTHAQPAAMQKDAVKMDKMTPAKQDVNAVYNAFLSKYIVKDGHINLVKYGSVTPEDKAKLDGYIDALSKSGPPTSSDEATIAYWFNLYNAKTISVIVENYPVKSIRDIGGSLFSPGPWGDKNLVVAGKEMSLNNIEHDTVRVDFDEPRIHYGFNCASIGCPNLKTTAWTEDNFEADLTQAAIDFIKSPRGISVDSRGRITASKIFDWYKVDFGGSDGGILSHTAKYASGDTKAALEKAKKIHNFEYDWTLNAPK